MPVVRSAARFAATGLAGTPRIADVTQPGELTAALAGAAWVISTAHARNAAAILAASPPGARFIFLGSTRKFTAWPDAHGNGVLAGEAAFMQDSRPGVFLHPTMIYGAQGEDNVRRLANLLARLPLVPLPNGGRALVQPIHQDDVTAAILAALNQNWETPETLVIAGPTPLPYADFVRAVARAANLAAPRIVPVPAAPLMAAASMTRFIPGLPRIGPAEIRRLLEDKAFDITPMRTRLGITPRTLAQGLTQTFALPPMAGQSGDSKK